MQDATHQYRDEMDTLADFLEECCVQDPQAWVPASKLHASHSQWCEKTGAGGLSSTALGLRLRERGFTDGRVGNPQVRGWYGLRVRGPNE